MSEYHSRLANPPALLDRFRGCLLGLAVGDALGTAIEFRAPGTFEPVSGITGGGPFQLPAGCWTDDTSMALCLGESLLACNGFDAADQMRRYLRWYRDGHLSSTGRCFDIGNTTRAALERFERTGDAYAGSSSPHTAGNGSIMRLAPVPMFFASTPRDAVTYAAASSRTTHAAVEAVDACRYFAALLVGTLNGRDRAEILDPAFAEGACADPPLAPAIAEVAAGSFARRAPPVIRGSGYVVRSLEAALWAFHRSSNFGEGALLAVNLGEDADTTGAVYGQIAGAYYGASSIPAEWLERLVLRDVIERMAEALSGR